MWPMGFYNNFTGCLFHYGVGIYNRFWFPKFNRRSRPRGLNQSNRYIQFIMQLFTKEITRSTKAFQGFFITSYPFTFGVVLRIFRSFFVNSKKTDIIIYTGWQNILYLMIVAHFHIRLSRTNPNFTDQYILQ